MHEDSLSELLSQMHQTLSDLFTICEPGTVKRSAFDIDVKAMLVTVTAIRMRQQLKFSEVASVKGIVSF